MYFLFLYRLLVWWIHGLSSGIALKGCGLRMGWSQIIRWQTMESLRRSGWQEKQGISLLLVLPWTSTHLWELFIDHYSVTIIITFSNPPLHLTSIHYIYIPSGIHVHDPGVHWLWCHSSRQLFLRICNDPNLVCVHVSIAYDIANTVLAWYLNLCLINSPCIPLYICTCYHHTYDAAALMVRESFSLWRSLSIWVSLSLSFVLLWPSLLEWRRPCNTEWVSSCNVLITFDGKCLVHRIIKKECRNTFNVRSKLCGSHAPWSHLSLLSS